MKKQRPEKKKKPTATPKRAGRTVEKRPKDKLEGLIARPTAPSGLASSAQKFVMQARLRFEADESIESSYDSWSSLRDAFAAARQQHQSATQELRDQAELLVGAVSHAAAFRESHSQPNEATALRLRGLAETSREALEAEIAKRAADWADAEAEWKKSLKVIEERTAGRVVRATKHAPPALRLMVRTLDGERRVVQADRPTNDEAIMLAQVLSQRIPTRYDAFFDDSTDDVSLPPNVVYPENGLPRRPSFEALLSAFRGAEHTFPMKASMWFETVLADGSKTWRWIPRASVMELELCEGETTRSILTKSEAEEVVGYFLVLAAEHRLRVELVRGRSVVHG